MLLQEALDRRPDEHEERRHIHNKDLCRVTPVDSLQSAQEHFQTLDVITLITLRIFLLYKAR